MTSRRQFLSTSAALLASGLPVTGRVAAASEPVLGDDGLFHQPWFMQTFLDLRDDLAEAGTAGKRFAVIWEQKGCPYCREMHRVNFARPAISDYVRENFGIVQLDIWGSREVVDFDGEHLEERALARKWRVNFTPTIVYLPEAGSVDGARPGHQLEIARMPGYFKPFHFLTMFEFVRDKAYEHESFQRYLQQKFARYEAEGRKPDVW